MPASHESPVPLVPTAYEYSAGYIIFRVENGERLYLVLHYPGGHFDFAKGHLEEGESNQQAAVRELTEETGIEKVSTMDGFEQPIVYSFRRKDSLIEKKVTFFLGETEDQKIKISHEHQGFLWLPYAQALTKITFENARSVLRAAEKFIIDQHKHEN